MTLQFRFRPTAIVAHIKSATLGTFTWAGVMTGVICVLSVLVPERPFWAELTAVALISAAVTFPLQFALHRRKKALRDLQEELQHALHHEPIIVTLCTDESVTSVEHVDRRRVSSAESPDGVILVVRVGSFDEIGRRYGQQWADTLLQSIARIVHSSVRYSDLVARIASDEVGIYLPSATTDNVSDICERIRARVYETTFLAGQERQISVTVRFGGTRVGDQSAFLALSDAANRAALAEDEAGPLLSRELFS